MVLRLYTTQGTPHSRVIRTKTCARVVGRTKLLFVADPVSLNSEDFFFLLTSVRRLARENVGLALRYGLALHLCYPIDVLARAKFYEQHAR